MNIALMLSRLAYKIFGPLLDPVVGNSMAMRMNIRKANMRITVGEYFSYAALVTMIMTPMMVVTVALRSRPLFPLDMIVTLL